MRVDVDRVLFVVGLAALLAAYTATDLHADPLSKPTAVEARNHLALGNKLYGVRSFDEAVTEYKAGAVIDPAPVFDYNLGQCYRQIGKYQEAIWHYERFVTRGKPRGKLLDAVNSFLTQMKSELDKKAMTQTPTEPEPSSSVGFLQAPPSPAAQQPQPEHLDVRKKEAWYHDTFGWGLTGAGVVAVTVGGGFLLSASSFNRKANASASQEEYNRLHSMVNIRASLGVSIGIGGAGLLVTGIIKLAVHSEGPSHVARWNIGASGKGVMVYGNF